MKHTFKLIRSYPTMESKDFTFTSKKDARQFFKSYKVEYTNMSFKFSDYPALVLDYCGVEYHCINGKLKNASNFNMF